jgi:hypothetical protein
LLLRLLTTGELLEVVDSGRLLSLLLLVLLQLGEHLR